MFCMINKPPKWNEQVRRRESRAVGFGGNTVWWVEEGWGRQVVQAVVVAKVRGVIAASWFAHAFYIPIAPTLEHVIVFCASVSAAPNPARVILTWIISSSPPPFTLSTGRRVRPQLQRPRDDGFREELPARLPRRPRHGRPPVWAHGQGNLHDGLAVAALASPGLCSLPLLLRLQARLRVSARRYGSRCPLCYREEEGAARSARGMETAARGEATLSADPPPSLAPHDGPEPNRIPIAFDCTSPRVSTPLSSLS
jgi:hypothetical protein